jgi:hypothetical protein
VSKNITSIPFDPSRYFNRKEIDSWLTDLESHVDQSDQNGRGGDVLRLLMSIVECRAPVETDDDAELVRRGIRLGLHLVAFDRKVFHRSVAKKTLTPRQPVVTDKQIIEVVKDQKFHTREMQAAGLGIGTRQLLKRLKAIREREL